MTKPLTIFMWGYWGWGNATTDLLALTSRVEKRRGFRPPIFVDIRVRRSVRAQGFNGDAFARRAKGRYRWMQDLGNQSIVTRQNRIRIRRPAAADELLDLAVAAARKRQRIIYFCSCDLPCDCHRTTVARLLVAAARRRKRAIQVVEWPGGEPTATPVNVQLPRATLKKFRRSRSGVPLPPTTDLAAMAGLPVGTIVTVSATGDEPVGVAVAPAMPAGDGWCLPVLWDSRAPVKAAVPAIRKWRKVHGYMAHR